MSDIPSVKSHPVIVSLITVTFFLATLVAGGFGGWVIRAAMESKAELSVVVDDTAFMRNLEIKTQLWIEEYNVWSENFYVDHPDTPDCLAQPLPSYYHENDYTQRTELEDEL